MCEAPCPFGVGRLCCAGPAPSAVGFSPRTHIIPLCGSIARAAARLGRVIRYIEIGCGFWAYVGWTLLITLTVRRPACRDPACSVRTFAELSPRALHYAVFHVVARFLSVLSMGLLVPQPTDVPCLRY